MLSLSVLSFLCQIFVSPFSFPFHFLLSIPLSSTRPLPLLPSVPYLFFPPSLTSSSLRPLPLLPSVPYLFFPHSLLFPSPLSLPHFFLLSSHFFLSLILFLFTSLSLVLFHLSYFHLDLPLISFSTLISSDLTLL